MKTDNELIDAFYVSQGDKPSAKADIHFYESSWDMLMPVVEKISQIGLAFEISLSLGVVCKICVHNHKTNMIEWHSYEETSSIRVVYKAVVEFIKWYNEQSK